MRNEGSITKTFTFNGKRYYINAPTERDAILKMAKKIQELESGRIVESSMLLKDWIEVCIDTYKTNLKDITLEKYRNRMKNCVVQHIGHKRLKDVKELDCQYCINQQIGHSSYMIKQTYQMLKFVFDKAVQNKLINSNPALYISLPKGHKEERRALTEKERDAFLHCAFKDRKYIAFLLSYYCGCRPTEALMVKGEDIIDINGVPHLWIKGTKSANANRQVPIPNDLYQVIKNTAKDSPIAVSTTGSLINEKQRQRYWNSLKRDMNIYLGCRMYRNELLPPYPLDDSLCHYSLRHDYATRLARRIPINQTKYLLGHSDIKITSNIYQHLTSTLLDTNDIIGAVSVVPSVVPSGIKPCHS